MTFDSNEKSEVHMMTEAAEYVKKLTNVISSQQLIGTGAHRSRRRVPATFFLNMCTVLNFNASYQCSSGALFLQFEADF
jgi:hypothetical protein